MNQLFEKEFAPAGINALRKNLLLQEFDPFMKGILVYGRNQVVTNVFIPNFKGWKSQAINPFIEKQIILIYLPVKRKRKNVRADIGDLSG